MSWIAPLLFQVQLLALVQTHSSSLEPPLSLVVYCGRIRTPQHRDIWWLAALSIAQPPGVLNKTLKQSSSVSLCVPASRMRRDKINEVSEAFWVFFRFLRAIVLQERKERSLSARNSADCRLHYPSHNVYDDAKALYRQLTAAEQLCVLFAIYILMPCHVIQWSQAKTLIQNNQRVGGFQSKIDWWEAFADTRHWPRCLLNPSFTRRACDKGLSQDQALWKGPTDLLAWWKDFARHWLFAVERGGGWGARESRSVRGCRGMGESKSKWIKLLYFF